MADMSEELFGPGEQQAPAHWISNNEPLVDSIKDSSPILEQGPAEMQETVKDIVEMNRASFPLDIEDSHPPENHFPFFVDPRMNVPLETQGVKEDALAEMILETKQAIQDVVGGKQEIYQQIRTWESEIEKNQVLINQYYAQIQKNLLEIFQDRQKRDHWLARAHQVMLDYSAAAIANRVEDWAWVIKKYGLKNNGVEIDPSNNCAEEWVSKSAHHLMAEYQKTVNQYEQSLHAKEAENTKATREHSQLKRLNDGLRARITESGQKEVEPLRAGSLLLVQLQNKLEEWKKNQVILTYRDLRAWAEVLLNDFIYNHPNIAQSLVTQFRKITSIPLPKEFS